MNLSEFDLNHVRSLHALVDEAHVARAAKRLGITPAAASNALRRLRGDFGDPLLVRAGRGLVRTALAEELRQPAREVLAGVERLLAAGARFDPRTFDGDFVLATSDRLAAVLLPAVDALLLKHAPRASLRVRTAPTDVASWVGERGRIAIGPFEARAGAIETEHLFDDEYICVLRRRHPLLSGPWSLRRFADAEHLLVTPRGVSDRGSVDDALEARGMSRRIARVVPTFALALPMLVGSTRIATLPASFVRAHADSLGLVLRKPPMRLDPLPVAMAWHPRYHGDPEHVWLRKLARDALVSSGLVAAR